MCRGGEGKSIGERKRRCGGVKKCGRVYVVSVGKCVEVWGR